MKFAGASVLALMGLTSTATASSVIGPYINKDARFALKLNQLTDLNAAQADFLGEEKDIIKKGLYVNVLDTSKLNETRTLLGTTVERNEALEFTSVNSVLHTFLGDVVYFLDLTTPPEGIQSGLLTLNETGYTTFTNDNTTLVPSHDSLPVFHGYQVCFGSAIFTGEMFFNVSGATEPSVNCVNVDLLQQWVAVTTE